MEKISKDYKRIINQLDDLKGHTKDMARDGEDIWKQDTQALDEAMDIIYDYQNMVDEHNRMMEKYEREVPVIKRGTDFYQCPACGKRTSRNHTHCHWCGRKLGWSR